jgi:energy-coupling factor transport system ATP-binding protein
VIRFDQVTFRYPDAPAPTLSAVDLTVPEGELCLAIGSTGSGKSTLLRAVNGQVPRFTGGRLDGDVVIAGRSTRDWQPRDLADVVGTVGQDPAAGFVTDVVEDELAYVMENLGVPPEAMRRRVEDVLDLLDLHPLRNRPLSTLSGGQQQRVAIGSVLTAHPRVLVLDEPTSALDPAAAEDVLAALTRLVHDLGITVLMAEHRLERVVQYADRVVIVRPDQALVAGDPAAMLIDAPVAPPVVELGRLASWEPLPLSIRDARRCAPELRDKLRESVPGSRPRRAPGEVLATARGLSVTYGAVTALDEIDLDLHQGEVVAVMGRNGSGKSTLLSHLVGLRSPARGVVRLAGSAPDELTPRETLRRAGLVPQDAGVLLCAESVGSECVASDHDADAPPGTTIGLLERLVPGVPPDRHPRDLSEGQRLGLALAIILAADPPLVLLDEPTRGLDYSAKARLVQIIDALARRGHGVVLATHDVEVVATVADRVVVLAEGEIVADGPAREVVGHSPVFAPQVAKIMAPQPWLTVGEIERALRGDP